MSENNENHVYKVIYVDPAIGERHFTIKCPESLEELHHELHQDIAAHRPLVFIEDDVRTTILPHPGVSLQVMTKEAYDKLIEQVTARQQKMMQQRAMQQGGMPQGVIAIPNLIPPRQ